MEELGLVETKNSLALQDHGNMIWVPEEDKLNASTSSTTKASRTLVWWDMESSPPPTTDCNPWDDIALHLVRMLALPSLQPHEFVTCIAYGEGEVPERLLFALLKQGIVVHQRNLPTYTLPGAGTTLGMKSMIVDILFWALNNAPPADVRIISAAEEPNFQKLVKGLHRRCYTVHLASSMAAFSLRHPRESSGSPSGFTTYWNSFWQQVPESEQALSPPQLQLLHNCLCPGTEVEYARDSSPQPTFKDVVCGANLNHGPSSPRKDKPCKTASTRKVRIPQPTMEDFRRWLESFVESEESLLGMEISLVAKSFETQHGLKLDLKSLGCKTLSKLLLEDFGDLVRLSYPSQNIVVMFPAKLSTQAMRKLKHDFASLLTELLPKKRSESHLSLLKSAFREKFEYDLDHEAAGYTKLNQFVNSMPTLVRVRPRSSLDTELVICRPAGYFAKQQT